MQKFAKYGHTAHDLEAQKMKPQILKVAKSFRQIFDEIVRQRQKFQSLKVDNFNGQAHETGSEIGKKLLWWVFLLLPLDYEPFAVRNRSR